MGTLWLTLTLIIWVAGGIYAGYASDRFYYSDYSRRVGEVDWGEVIAYSGIVFVIGLFSVPVVGIALVVASFALPAYGLYKAGQKIRARKDLKSDKNA